MRKLLLILSILLCAVTIQATPIELSLDGSTHDSTKIEESDLDGARAIELSLYGLDFDPIVWYKMDDNAASTTVIDSMALINGTFTENTEDNDVVGTVDEALNFDGNDYVALSTSSALNPNEAMTITAWARCTSFAANRAEIGRAHV